MEQCGKRRKPRGELKSVTIQPYLLVNEINGTKIAVDTKLAILTSIIEIALPPDKDNTG